MFRLVLSFFLAFFTFVLGMVVSGSAFADEVPVKELQGEIMITKSEEKAIEQLNHLLKKYRGTKLEPGLVFRQGELYMRRAKSARFFEMNTDSEAVVRFTPRVLKSTGSIKYVQKAVDAYESIQKKHPKFEDIDVVLFNNAFARQQIGQTDAAAALYRRLLAEEPHSPLVPDAHLALGEIFYDRRKFDEARVEFAKIQNYPESRVFPYGIYKLAWSYYNLRDTESGLKALEDVALYGKKVRESGGNPKLDLRREALNDIVLFYSELYKGDRALKYFQKIADEGEIGFLLVKLARIYRTHGRHQEFQDVLLAIIDTYPNSVDRPQAHYDLIEFHEEQKQRRRALVQLKQLSDICDPEGRWMRQNSAKSGEEESPGKRCLRLFFSHATTLATRWHQLWLKDKKAGDLAEVAEEAYLLYLYHSNGENKFVQARYGYAELLFAREKFRPASNNYEKVALSAHEPKLKHDAYYGALVALEKDVKGKWDDRDEALMRGLIDGYTKAFPKGEHVRELAFTKAFVAYDKGRMQEAEPQLFDLASGSVQDPRTQKAQDFYLDILNIKKDYKGIKERALAFSKSTTEKSRKDKLQKIHEEAYFKEVEALEESKQLEAAVKLYRSFADANPTSALADKALLNAARLQIDLGLLAASADTYVTIYKTMPQSPGAIEALSKAAQTYEFVGELGKAASVLEELVKLDPKSEEKWRQVAADFHLLTGDYSKARIHYTQLLQSKDPAQISHAYDSLWAVEERSGNKLGLRKLRQAILDKGIQPAASLLHLEELEAVFQQKDYTLAFRKASDILRMEKASKKALSKARFIQAQILGSEFQSQSVQAKPERIALVLGMKTEKLEKAQKAYQSALNYGDPQVAVESIRQTAFLYDHYAKSIRKIQLPEDLDKKDAALLMAEFEKLALPMEEKVVDTLAQALNQAKRLKLRDGVIARIQMDIHRANLQPAEDTLGAVEVPPALALSVPSSEKNPVAGLVMNDIKAGRCKSPVAETKDFSDLSEQANFCARDQKWNEVVKLARKMFEVRPKSPWPAYYMSLAAEAEGARDRALWMIELALRKDARQGIVHFQKSRLLWAGSSYTEAVDTLEEAVKLSPDLVDAHLFLAQVDFRDQIYAKAAQSFLAVQSQRPRNPIALSGLTECRIQARDGMGAMEFAKKAVDAFPEQANFHLREAFIYENLLGLPQQALDVYKRVEKLYTNRKLRGEIRLNLVEKVKSLEDSLRKPSAVADTKQQDEKRGAKK